MTVLDYGNPIDAANQHQLNGMGEPVIRGDRMIQAHARCKWHQNGFDFA
jgi:hypothetical protein